MPEIDPNEQPCDCVRGRSYPKMGATATSSLMAAIEGKFAMGGGMSFADFMAMALYDAEYGYYATSARQVGRGGDFYTSVSVGPLFGRLLARRFVRWWEGNGRPARWRMIEVGAHDGKLAADVLGELSGLSAEALAGLEYVIPEPLLVLRSAQRERLAGFSANVVFVENVGELHGRPLPGIVFGNEIIDALPFHLIRMGEDGWREVFVVFDGKGELVLTEGGAAPVGTLAELLPQGEFPVGYQTEVRVNLDDFLGELAKALEGGMMIFCDYGFAAPEYYDVSRSKGTLRTFSGHVAGDDPLLEPGLRDITAHVDFTALARAAERCGFRATEFQGQGAWLTELARPLLLAMEGRPDLSFLRQFQSLTHPAHLGGSFHVIELCAGGEVPERVAHRLALF